MTSAQRLEPPLAAPVGRYRSERYRDDNPTWHTEDSAWKAGQLLAMIKRNRLDPRAVLDVGCGAGEVLLRLRDDISPEAELVGYDIAPQALEFARARATGRIEFRDGDGLEPDGRVFDLALVVDVLEHVENPFVFLRRLRDRAAFALFHIPLDLNALAAALNRPLNDWRLTVGHLHSFTKDLAMATLRESGLEPIDWRYTPSSFVVPPPTAKAKALQMARWLGFRWKPDLTVRLLGGYSLLVLTRCGPRTNGSLGDSILAESAPRRQR